MAAATRLKASEKQAICKKLVMVLKKRYGGSAPKNNLDVLHTLLFAICLEENSQEGAEALYDKLLATFHDLNEIRVSSITELEAVFTESAISEWRALRTRSLLHYVFEETFQYEYEGIRRKTQEQAAKALSRVKDISPFMALQTLQSVLGSHVVPLDTRMLHVAIWLGLVDPKSSIDSASDQLKPVVRKSDVTQFCHLVRGLASDDNVRVLIEQDLADPPEEGFDGLTATDRLAEVFAAAAAGGRPKKTVAKPESGRTTGKKKTAKKTTSQPKTAKNKTAAKSATSSARKTAKKKTASRKKKSR